MEFVTGQRMNAADWNAVVQNMVVRGAQPPDGDVKAIVEYLRKTLGRQVSPWPSVAWVRPLQAASRRSFEMGRDQ